MNPTLKRRLLDNTFVDDVLCSMSFDERAYAELLEVLSELASVLTDADSVDKEVALYLYAAPQMIRNQYLSFAAFPQPPPIAVRLEDAWIELDALVLDCLGESSNSSS